MATYILFGEKSKPSVAETRYKPDISRQRKHDDAVSLTSPCRRAGVMEHENRRAHVAGVAPVSGWIFLCS